VGYKKIVILNRDVALSWKRYKTEKYTVWQKKLHPFILAITLSNHIFDNFWQKDTEVNLQQNCNEIAHLS